MIPYDDLVIALAAWRARQGLPVAQLPRAARPPAPSPARATPPVAPPRAPATLIADELDDGGLVEDAPYDSGDDYVLPLGGVETAESTAIGGAPEAAGVQPPKRW